MNTCVNILFLTEAKYKQLVLDNRSRKCVIDDRYAMALTSTEGTLMTSVCVRELLCGLTKTFSSRIRFT